MSAHDTPEVGSGETVGERVHWIGEHRNTLHGNGAGSKDMERVSGDEDEVTCNLCLSLLARDDVRERITPASPDPVQPAGAGEGLSEAEREQVALACDAMFDFGDTWIRFLRDGNETVLLPAVERILAARVAAWAEKYAAVVGEAERIDRARCIAIDVVRRERRRAESAEAALATVLREKAEDRARVEAAVDIEAVLTRHILHASMNVCLCGDWRAKLDAGSLAEQHRTHVARALRAALAIPTATGDE